MNVDAEGDSLCATAHIKVTTWDDKLAGIKQSKGKGYSGAQLTNLQIEISKDTTGTVLIYKSVDAVTD
jgi:expansin (peptidoglycan-binding protein)